MADWRVYEDTSANRTLLGVKGHFIECLSVELSALGQKQTSQPSIRLVRFVPESGRAIPCFASSIPSEPHAKIGTGFGTERPGTARDCREHSYREVNVNRQKFGQAGIIRDLTIRLPAHWQTAALSLGDSLNPTRAI
jgi:hypothetical protein